MGPPSHTPAVTASASERPLLLRQLRGQEGPRDGSELYREQPTALPRQQAIGERDQQTSNAEPGKRDEIHLRIMSGRPHRPDPGVWASSGQQADQCGREPLAHDAPTEVPPPARPGRGRSRPAGADSGVDPRMLNRRRARRRGGTHPRRRAHSRQGTGLPWHTVTGPIEERSWTGPWCGASTRRSCGRTGMHLGSGLLWDPHLPDSDAGSGCAVGRRARG